MIIRNIEDMCQIKFICILGLWLFISGHMPELGTGFNMTIVGIIITILGLNKNNIWQGKVIGFLGIWLILSGLVFDFVVPVNFFLISLVVVIVAYSCVVDEQNKKPVSKNHRNDSKRFFQNN